MPFLRSSNYDCAAVAVLNTCFWLGEDVSARWIRPLARELGIGRHNGVTGTEFDRWAQRTENLQAIKMVQPSAEELLSELRRGHGVILRYRWTKTNPDHPGHFAFLCMTRSGRLRVANPHNALHDHRSRTFRYVDPSELVEMCDQHHTSRGRYPMAWIVDKCERNKLRQMTSRWKPNRGDITSKSTRLSRT